MKTFKVTGIPEINIGGISMGTDDFEKVEFTMQVDDIKEVIDEETKEIKTEDKILDIDEIKDFKDVEIVELSDYKMEFNAGFMQPTTFNLNLRLNQYFNIPASETALEKLKNKLITAIEQFNEEFRHEEYVVKKNNFKKELAEGAIYKSKENGNLVFARNDGGYIIATMNKDEDIIVCCNLTQLIANMKGKYIKIH